MPERRLVDKAKEFATQAHAGQFRKTSITGQERPYIYHPGKVVDFLAASAYNNEDLLAAAWLHDVIEDCGITHAHLEREFNLEVANLVRDVSHPVSIGNRKERWLIYLAFYKSGSKEAQILKLADRVCNLQEYLDFWNESSDSEKRFIKNIYLKESYELAWALYDAQNDFAIQLFDLIKILKGFE